MSRNDLPCVCMSARRAANALTYYYDKMFDKMGITVNQYSLMKNIKAAGVTNITELTHIVKLDKSTLTRTLAPLIDAGYIHSERGKNRREVILSLTEKGQEKFETVYPFWKKTQDEMIELLGGETAAERFIDTLIRLQSLKER